MFIPVSTLLCAVLKGVDGDISSGMATLRGVLKATLGGRYA